MGWADGDDPDRFGRLDIAFAMRGIEGGGNAGYSTTKGALRLLTKSVAMHCAKAGLSIRCNTIHPGVVETPLIADAIAPDRGTERDARWIGPAQPHC